MKFLSSIILILFAMPDAVIFHFSPQSEIRSWVIVDDVVMGGRSSGSFGLNEDGHGVFEGRVSLENNGGFSSVRHTFPKRSTDGYSKVSIRLKGDGKNYQFRVKANARDYYSYITTFSTSGEWQTVEIQLEDMYPSFRGRKLDMDNFSKAGIEEIAFLIANKKAESFKLVIEKIELK